MTYLTSAKVLKSIVSLAIVASVLPACNSSRRLPPGTTTAPAQEERITFNNTTETTPSTVAVMETAGFYDLNNTNNAVSDNTGTYNHLTSQLTSQGKTVDVTKGDGYDYMPSFDDGSGQIGIAVLATQTMPTAGTANYTGTASYIFTIGAAQTAHTEQATTIAADFATGNVDIDVTGDNTIAMRNLLIDGAKGTFEEQSSSTSSIGSSAMQVTALGRFAGPTAQEAAAIVHMTDNASGTVEMLLIAKQ
jgi:hypothetical protein